MKSSERIRVYRQAVDEVQNVIGGVGKGRCDDEDVRKYGVSPR